MASVTPREAADFRVRGALGWGTALTAVGLLLLVLAWTALPDRAAGGDVETGNDAVILLVLALLGLVPGLVLLQVGLVAVGVRLGLVAHGVPPADERDGR